MSLLREVRAERPRHRRPAYQVTKMTICGYSRSAAENFTLVPAAELGPDLHPDAEVEPLGGRAGLFDMVGAEGQIAGGEENLADLRILLQLGAHGGDDQP